MIHADTQAYNDALPDSDQAIAALLAQAIDAQLADAENKIWHAHPVWFLDGNPVVGYSKLKGCMRLLFWSGQSFDEPELQPEGRFKAAEARFTAAEQINHEALRRWLEKSRAIQWDYQHLVKRRGRLERLK